MSTVLRRNQHELVKYNSDDSMLLFGTLDTGYLTTTPPAIEGAEMAANDLPNAREDGIRFGEDYRGSKTVTFEVAVLTDREPDPAAAMSQKLSEFESAWATPAYRNHSNNVTTLRSCMVPGRTRVAYGRPRRWVDTPTNNDGLSNVVCDFVNQDGKWYDENWRNETIGDFRYGSNGLTAPLRSDGPVVVFGGSGSGARGIMRVGGVLPTWPMIEFNAGTVPLNGPIFYLNGWKIGIGGDIPAGMYVRVDTRPWQRVVWRNDGANYSGRVTMNPPMSHMAVPPGDHVAYFEANDIVNGVAEPSSRGWVNLWWQDAWPRW